MFHDKSLAALFADPADLTPAECRALAAKLDRLTARFAYGVIAATVLIFGGQFVRYLIQSGVL
jgi:hypothetical protein